MLNNGDTTWNRAQQYTLISQSPEGNLTWGNNRVPLPVDNIAPGQSVTFNFPVTAPATAGSHAFAWGMQREGYGAFGTAAAPVTVNVTAAPPLVNNAQVVGMSVAERMQTKLGYKVAVTMQNTGTTTWTPGALYRLGSQNPYDNQTWGPSRIAIATPVAPGQQYTFDFQVTAPAPDSYSMQWAMVQDGVAWFGSSAARPVTVTEDLSHVTFIHTDGLGSPVARSDGVGKIISRTRYEPYGHVASGAMPTIGFTGHVNDADTGLTYMQQRYYDPVAGRFLSVDPMVTDANSGGSFNRYAYAINNPYRYIDPDGRDARDYQIADHLKKIRDNFCSGRCGGDVRSGEQPAKSIRSQPNGAVITNNQFVDETTTDLNAMAMVAMAMAGEGSDPLYGTKVHTYFAQLVRESGRDDVHAEQSFDLSGLVRYGLPGAIRTDVILGTNKERPVAIYDLKTGSEKFNEDDKSRSEFPWDDPHVLLSRRAACTGGVSPSGSSAATRASARTAAASPKRSPRPRNCGSERTGSGMISTAARTSSRWSGRSGAGTSGASAMIRKKSARISEPSSPGPAASSSVSHAAQERGTPVAPYRRAAGWPSMKAASFSAGDRDRT